LRAAIPQDSASEPEIHLKAWAAGDLGGTKPGRFNSMPPVRDDSSSAVEFCWSVILSTSQQAQAAAGTFKACTERLATDQGKTIRRGGMIVAPLLDETGGFAEAGGGVQP
jgi:hypothetical protein